MAWWTSVSGLMTGIGTFIGVAGLIIAIAALLGDAGPAKGSDLAGRPRAGRRHRPGDLELVVLDFGR